MNFDIVSSWNARSYWRARAGLPEPGYNFGGALVGREDWIEHFGDDAIIHNKHHALEQRHSGSLEGG